MRTAPHSAARPSRAWTWASLMRRVFDFDVLTCPRCGGRLRVIATVQDPLVVQAILATLPAPAPAHTRPRPTRARRHSALAYQSPIRYARAGRDPPSRETDRHIASRIDDRPGGLSPYPPTCSLPSLQSVVEHQRAVHTSAVHRPRNRGNSIVNAGATRLP
jgi:hypothetical protein